MENKDYIIQTILGSGRRLKPVIRRTKKGVSDYANRMYDKYGDDVTVEVGYFKPMPGDLKWVPVTTYHA